MGYTRVRHYDEGLLGWKERGERVESIAVARPVNASPARAGGTVAGHGFVDRVSAMSFGALLVAWLAVVLGSGLAYWLGALVQPSLREGDALVTPSLHGLGTSLYFSVVTATSP